MKQRNVLIVDDNDRYANNLISYFEQKGNKTIRAISAYEGWEKFTQFEFNAVITDITMETQTSGLWLARKIYKSGFNGDIIVATTGFDVPGVMFFSKYFLPMFAGIGFMIPKVPLKKGEVIFYPTSKKIKETSFYK